ncbi:MAG: DnaJ domain-containing protein [Lachnospiraceae bacterium]|nr:DnaJ domain-containing protein [Lachnospiraceae bacterium]
MDEQQAKRILGITETDNARTAKIKFRRLIGRYHPDVAGGDSPDFQEQAQRINAAYSLLKSKNFFVEKEENIILWRAPVSDDAFIERNIYAPYHMDIDTGGLYQTLARGKYMWNPDEEEFQLFLRSLLHAVKDLLDEEESKCGIYGGTDSLRIPFQKQLFHCLAMQFVAPLYCLEKIAEPETTDEAGQKVYCFRAYIGEKHDREIMKRMISLQKGDAVYPVALQDWKLMVADSQGNDLGYISFAEDELYYCLFPLMRAHLVQTKMTVVKVQKNKEKYLRQAKAEIAFRVRLQKGAEQYRNPDMNREINQILYSYNGVLTGRGR